MSMEENVWHRSPDPGSVRSPQGETSYGWHTRSPNRHQALPAHDFDIDTQLEWLLARRPAYLMSFAGIIKELAITAKRRGIALKFDLVFSVAAVLDAETRELCRSAFGAEIADTYGRRRPDISRRNVRTAANITSAPMHR